MSDVTIYYNPGCGNCRETLALIRGKGIEPRIVEYLTAPLSAQTLKELTAAMGLAPRDLLREKDPLYDANALADPKWSDDELIGFMLANRTLINRPVVVTPLATRLCRPPATVLEILP